MRRGMIAVVQRVKSSHVTVRDSVSGRIGQGLLVLLGVGEKDTEEDAAYLARKIPDLRIFEDSQGKMNLSVRDVHGEMLVVSQFTLLADCRKGRRPSFIEAARPEQAKHLYDMVIDHLKSQGDRVQTGQFQEHMEIHLINDGPVTLILDSKAR